MTKPTHLKDEPELYACVVAGCTLRVHKTYFLLDGIPVDFEQTNFSQKLIQALTTVAHSARQQAQADMRRSLGIEK